jgi:hypothetical protein
MYENRYKNPHITASEELERFLNLIADYDYKFKHLEREYAKCKID